jgi:hypothetical protein
MSPLKRKPTFEEVVQDAELPPFRVKLPDRYATFLAESPALAVLDEDLNEQFSTTDILRGGPARICSHWARGVVAVTGLRMRKALGCSRATLE